MNEVEKIDNNIKETQNKMKEIDNCLNSINYKLRNESAFTSLIKRIDWIYDELEKINPSNYQKYILKKK